jgi:hypothetical protein
MREVLNDDRNKKGIFPKTRQKVIDGARMHIPSVQMMRASGSHDRQSMPIIYNTLNYNRQPGNPCACIYMVYNYV